MLMRFDPFADFDRLGREAFRGGRSVMPVDAYRLDDRLYLHLDLPGVDPDSIDITIEKNTLTVNAERSWTPDENATVIMSERAQGSFSRSFFLGEGLNSEAIEAGYDHGVLTIKIPVAEAAKPKKIVIGAGDKALTA